jgi:two-component system sensor histidine kinase ChvG
VSLRTQLFGLGLLTLVLPWAAYRYVQELEVALRDGLEQALLASAETIATAFESSALGVSAEGAERVPDSTVYAQPLSSAPQLDGYQNDWNLPTGSERFLGASGRYWAAVHERSLYLFMEIEDDALVYQSAPTELPYGDRMLLLPGAAGGAWLLVHTTAPGLVRPQYTSAPEFTPSGRFEERALAYWRDTGHGYALELRLPLDLVGAQLGLAAIDVDPQLAATRQYTVTMERSWPDTMAPPALVYRPVAVALRAAPFQQSGKRLRVVDHDGWVLFDGGAIDPLERFFSPETIGPLEQLLRVILARGDPAYAELENPPGYVGNPELRRMMGAEGGVAWFARGTTESAIVVAVAPIGTPADPAGAVVLEQGSDSILTLTNDALVDLMGFALLASVVVALGLLSYATYLSVRVRRLARAADTALGPRGEIDVKLPGRDARDEIGDLARSFTTLLGKLEDHTHYLTTLKGKLAHELRTPLAVVATSLDNLEREPHGDHLTPYMARLREGSDRLDRILAAMSEATALEHAVTSMSRERFDLVAVVAGSVAAYRDLYRDRRFDYAAPVQHRKILGSAELIAQMLDKLVDNAVSFSDAGSVIVIEVADEDGSIVVSVANQGPPLPGSMRGSLFDSLVSVRAEGGQRGHLGLGLYVVALVAKFHGGTASAYDLPDGSGVVFRVRMPAG